MSGRFLLDTNIVIGLFAQDAGILVELNRAAETFLPSITLGELYFGAHKSEPTMANIARIDELAAASTVVACDIDTARVYGRIKNHLRAKGRPIPENDIWIAALAMQHSLTLVSRDPHLREVSDLSLVQWL